MTIDKFQSALLQNLRAGALLLGVLSLAMSGLLVTSGDAHAKKKQSQGFFNFFDAPPPPRSYRVYGQRRKAQPARRQSESKTAETKSEERQVKGPLVLTVSLAKQRVTVHDIDGPVAEAPISSGNAAYPTLQGVFSILEKSKVHYSNLYAGASMPNMQRLTWSGTAMHAGHLPGYPASHGCIRLPHNFSKKLFGMTKLGTRVLVTRDPIAPVPISHANLIAPLPPEQTQEAAIPGETKVAEQRDYESVRALTLIATASAAESSNDATPAAPPLTGYRAKRAAEKQRVEDARATAEAAKIDAELAAKDAVAAADTVRETAKVANIEAARLANELKKAEQLRSEGDKALEAFGRKFADGKELRADEHLKAAQTEKELEDKTFDLGRNVESARLAAESSQATADRAKAAIAEAVGKVKRQANILADVNRDLKKAEATLASFARQEKVRKQPVSVLISRSAGRLFVRQGYEPIFDIPVSIKEPDVAIGTHVFTALELTGPTDMRWSATSIPYKSRPEANSKKRRNAEYDVAPESSHLPQTPQSALDRVTIPEDARERIADVMKPGSSIIISDYGISHQTGEYTEFIILTR